MPNVIVWADIPVVDLERAMKFYADVTQQPVVKVPDPTQELALIGGPDDSGASIVSADLYVGGKPSHDGATIYLNSYGDIDGMVARVAPAGGKVLEEKQFFGDMVGWIAIIEDSEGNRIGIQQPAEGK